MYRLLRNLFPFLLIALFLAPQVTLAFHQFEHSRDFHCDTANSHFHEQEHHCLICDINVTLTSADIFNHQVPQVLFLFTGLLTIIVFYFYLTNFFVSFLAFISLILLYVYLSNPHIQFDRRLATPTFFRVKN